MPVLISHLTAKLRHRWRLVRQTKDGGYSTEAVLVTALLVAMALIVIGVIVAKVTAKANDINL
jgi:hypothetical protein